MAIGSTNYAQPVQVNGFTCKNCTDVDYAKKHIDPSHPKSGPYGVDAATDSSANTKPAKPADAPAAQPVKALAAPGTAKLVDVSA